jgi:hypothetical protein
MSALVASSFILGGNLMANTNVVKSPLEAVSMVSEWDKVFAKSDKVDHKKVKFKNRYGVEIVGDLYTPKNLHGKAAAIAVSGPFGAVKEQSSGLYAQTLAERGFITLAFDPSYTGESGGEPRNLASPEINTDDFSAAVDFLGTKSNIDRDKIGILGVCGWGGFALNAALADPRIKAVATSTMYDMTRVMAKGYNDSVGADERYETKKKLAEQRWVDAKNGKPAYTGAINVDPKKIDASTPQFIAQYADYYRTPRGYHKRSVNSNSGESGWTKTNPISFINMPILAYASEMRTPILIVAGEKAHSRYFSEDAFKSLGNKNKELVIVPGAVHTDLYDNKNNKIPYDKFEEFFKANLK